MVATLRAVQPGEGASRPRRGRAKSVTEAAEKGTQLELLEAMRARVAKAVQSEETPPRDLAALTKRLVDIVKEIEAIKARDEPRSGSPDVPDDDSFDPSSI